MRDYEPLLRRCGVDECDNSKACKDSSRTPLRSSHMYLHREPSKQIFQHFLWNRRRDPGEYVVVLPVHDQVPLGSIAYRVVEVQCLGQHPHKEHLSSGASVAIIWLM